jgi:probable HAF family extracellular repeat protein
MFRNVQPDNSAAAEQAFFRTPDGVYHDVEGPDGELVTLTGLNDNGQAVGTFTTAAGGQQAFVFDTTTATLTILPRPTADTVELLPTAINNSGDIVGAYGEGTPEFPWVSVHGFLALPAGREHQ